MVTIGICLILSLLGGYIGPYLRELLPYPWEGGAAAVPIIVENLADNPWEDVADSVIESSVSIYIGSRGGGVDSIDAGSGVVISSDGYILTNAHVVENAGRAYKTEIYLYGEDYRYETNGPLELAAIDEELDLAVIKLPSGSFTPARLGDSDSVQLGDDVMAVGNSLGVYLDTVSRGAISHLSRDIQYDSGVVIKNEFQTDAAISPGNSGGGLYNNRGELIGLINANTTYDNMAQNLNFAIRINTAIEFIRSELGEGIISNESTLDMRLTDFIKESGYSAEEEAYSDGDGVYITDIEQYGAAYYARLIEGDKIVSIDGREVLQVADVQSYIKGCDIGKEVTVVISRMGLLYEYRIKTMRAW
jgi:serine protease Do